MYAQSESILKFRLFSTTNKLIETAINYFNIFCLFWSLTSDNIKKDKWTENKLTIFVVRVLVEMKICVWYCCSKTDNDIFQFNICVSYSIARIISVFWRILILDTFKLLFSMYVYIILFSLMSNISVNRNYRRLRFI